MKFRSRLYLPFMLGLGVLAIASVSHFGGPGDGSTGTTDMPAPLPLPRSSVPAVVEETISLTNAAQLKPLYGDVALAVMVGGTAGAAACDRTGKIVNLDTPGEPFLIVREGPSVGAKEKDRLSADAQVYLCDHAEAGAWTGIVYEPGGSLGAGCGVTTPIEKRDPYIGTCRSGWVSSRHIEPVAG